MRLAACLLALATSGCALLANANANHNSGGTACLDEPMFGVIDLVIAGASLAAVLYDEDTSKGYLAIPITFGASGVLGTISAIRCRGDSREGVADLAPPASNTAPSFGDAPVDPEARDATREELGLEPAPALPPTLTLDRNGLPATLPPAPPTPAPTTPKPNAPKPLECKLEPKVLCPDGYYCSLVAENTGVCVAIH
jgi:hypothetical protein